MIPTRKRSRKPLIITLVVLGILTLCGLSACIAYAGVAASLKSDPTLTQVQTQTAQPAGQAQSNATKPSGWGVVTSYKGNGSQSTGKFTVPANWRIKWACDPASVQYLDSWSLDIMPQGEGAAAYDNTPLTTTCSAKNKSGVTEYHTGGPMFLQITAMGDWEITVEARE